MTSAFVLLTLLASQADSILKRGKPVPATPGITVGSVLANPTQYADAPVVLEGMVVRSCTKMGCWMQLADSTGAPGVRVDFHSEKFYIPVGAAGMRAPVTRTVFVSTTTSLRPPIRRRCSTLSRRSRTSWRCRSSS